MTGTPVENQLEELWSILNVTSPGLLGSRARFRQRFAVPIQQAPTFSPGTPRKLFRIERPGSSEWGDIYDVAPDSNRFVVLLRQEESKRKPRLEVIVNFRKTLAEGTP